MAESGETELKAKRSFWSTLPGMISAAAGLLGAIAAILGALATIGVFNGSQAAPAASGTGLAAVEALDSISFTYAWTKEEGKTQFSRAEVTSVPQGSRIVLTCQAGNCDGLTHEQRFQDSEPSTSVLSWLPRVVTPGMRLELRLSARDVGQKLWVLTSGNTGVEEHIFCEASGDAVLSTCS